MKSTTIFCSFYCKLHTEKLSANRNDFASNLSRKWFSRVPKSHWYSVENQRIFLDEVAMKLKIKKASDWGKVGAKYLYALGGAGILKYYNDSIFNCLQSIYKGRVFLFNNFNT